MYLLSKILAFAISPFNMAVLLIVIGLFFRKYRRKLLVLAFVVLLVFSNPLLFRLTIGWWEGTPDALPRNSPHCANIVVLGGMSAQHESSGRIRFFQSSDRLMQTLLLKGQNSVERIIVAGGNASIVLDKKPEAAYLKEFLVSLGINERQILTDTLSRNTFENALFTKRLFEADGLPKRITLVTSAWHMPRARRCFEKQGFRVNRVEADFMQPMNKLTPAEVWIPSAGTLAGWELLLKEWVGLVYYRLRGYI